MFILTAKVPKRSYFLLAAFVVVLLAASVFFLKRDRTGAEDTSEQPRVETNDERIAYLSSLGWEAEGEPVESLRLTLPQELVEPYRSYNELQLRQGFDLSALLGKSLERYTYTITNYPGRPKGCQADLFIYQGEVVAGDIICAGADGFIATLEYPNGQAH
ncbi:MAG: DUF4830 domain-containing protein [Oscillospiraceae bacterium]|nr:DUF4830 domain-containing protein [Oscillospiraceae bacterium]